MTFPKDPKHHEKHIRGAKTYRYCSDTNTWLLHVCTAMVPFNPPQAPQKETLLQGITKRVGPRLNKLRLKLSSYRT